MGLINGNGNGPGNGDPFMTKQAMSSDLSSPWHPHPPSLLHPPPLIPQHMQSDHHSHHSSSTLHSQQNLQHHDNIVSLNDVNGGFGPNGGPDPNEESATSDLATSFFGYRYVTFHILIPCQKYKSHYKRYRYETTNHFSF